MHKAIMVYGPETIEDLRQLMESFSEESLNKQQQVYSFKAFDSNDLIWERILTIVKTFDYDGYEPSIHLVSKQDFECEYFSPTRDIDFIITYDGNRLADLYTWSNEYIYDWFAVGGRWDGLLIGKSDDLVDVLDPTPRGPLSSDEIAARTQLKAMGMEVKDRDGYNSLRLKDIGEYRVEPYEADVVIGRIRAYEEKAGCKTRSMEQVFSDEFGVLYNETPDEMKRFFIASSDAYRKCSNIWWEQIFCTQKPERLGILECDDYRFFGLTDDEIRTFCSMYARILGGFIVDGEYYSLDNLSIQAGSKDRFFQGIELIKELPDTTVVTVVDIHC